MFPATPAHTPTPSPDELSALPSTLPEILSFLLGGLLGAAGFLFSYRLIFGAHDNSPRADPQAFFSMLDRELREEGEES